MADANPQRYDEPKHWPALAECIRSGQVPDEDVPQIMRASPDFAIWYAKQFAVGDECHKFKTINRLLNND